VLCWLPSGRAVEKQTGHHVLAEQCEALYPHDGGVADTREMFRLGVPEQAGECALTTCPDTLQFQIYLGRMLGLRYSQPKHRDHGRRRGLHQQACGQHRKSGCRYFETARPGYPRKHPYLHQR